MTAAALRIWTWPIVLGVLTAIGLVTALVSDSWGDVVSWFGLGIPVLICAWFGLRRSSSRPAAPRKTS